MKNSFADILKNLASEGDARLEEKVPQWASTPGITWPSSLSVEQCSSADTARRKAESALQIAGPQGRIADLTGGLGVDCWAFSQALGQVLYNERDTALFQAVQHNFALLGVDNVTFRNQELRPDGAASLIGDFKPDIIFLDPARRDSAGKKVFLLEDCSPDITALEDELLAICPHIMLKLSPMADIAMVCKRLGCVREVHVVESSGECKELLCILEKGFEGEPLTVLESGQESLEFLPSQERLCSCSYPEPARQYHWLFVPGSAAMKAGAFKLLARRFGMVKLAPSTHLYFCDDKDPAAEPFGKYWPISDVRPLNGAEMRRTGKEYPRCGVTARNIPMSSEALRKKMGSADGGRTHVFGVEIAWDDAPAGRYLIISDS
jgi:16S rRNA G966 N2-methylase RsmD